MKIELLRSTFEASGGSSNRQHLTCFIVNDSVAIDAGSLAMACRDEHREKVRNVVLTHAHLDHIAGLPLFIDDLFSSISSPITIHASRETIEILERDVFNWNVYPKFSELQNSTGKVIEYRPFTTGIDFNVAGLTIKPLAVNHKVPSSGFLISDADSMIAISGDTFHMTDFWNTVNGCRGLSALFIECAFPDELSELARISYHLTPRSLDAELKNFTHQGVPVYVINMKPMFREKIVAELADLGGRSLGVIEPGRSYEF